MLFVLTCAHYPFSPCIARRSELRSKQPVFLESQLTSLGSTHRHSGVALPKSQSPPPSSCDFWERNCSQFYHLRFNGSFAGQQIFELCNLQHRLSANQRPLPDRQPSRNTRQTVRPAQRQRLWAAERCGLRSSSAVIATEPVGRDALVAPTRPPAPPYLVYTKYV